MAKAATSEADSGPRFLSPYWRALGVRTLALALLWLMLTGGDWGSWYLGLPTVAFALWASVRLAPPPAVRLSLFGALFFLVYFAGQSFKGGLQVAIVSLTPGLDFEPAEIEIAMRLPPGPSQLLLASALSLMPGTLAMGVDNNRLRLHVLDKRQPIEQDVRRTERWIARIYREPLA